LTLLTSISGEHRFGSVRRPSIPLVV